jgi:CHAT domain-containing protein/Tfp pilus assembly protein PilF
MMVLKYVAYIFLFIFICLPYGTSILRAQEQTTQDFCRQMMQLADEKKESELKSIIAGHRSECIDCINTLLDSFVVCVYNAEDELALSTQTSISSLAGLYAIVFDDHYYLEKAQRYFSFSASDIRIKQEVAELKKKAIEAFYKGDFTTAQQTLQESLSKAEEINALDDQANIIGIIGAVYFYQGDFDSALVYYKHSLNLLKNIGNRAGQANCLNNMANVYSDRSEYDRALSFFGEALAIHLELDDQRGLAADYNNMGLVNEERGDYQSALGQYNSALAINTSLENRRSMVKNMANIANVHINLGDYDKALDLYNRTIPIRKELEDRKGEGNDYGNLGIIYDYFEENQTARQYYRMALDIHEEIGYKEGVAYQYGRLGSLYLKTGKYARATEMYQKALELHHEMGHARGEAYWLEALGTVFANVNDYDRSLDHFYRALEIHRSIKNRSGEAACLGQLGHTYIDLENYQAAEKCFKTARDLYDDLDEKRGKCISLSNLAHLFYETSNPDSGLYYCRRAKQILQKMNVPGLLAWIQLQTGDLYRARGDLELAAKAYEQGLAMTEGLQISEIRWQIYFGNAKIFESKGEIQNAYYAYRAAINLIEDIRGQAVIEEMKSGILPHRYDAYTSIILLLAGMDRPEEALTFVERSRARNMLDILGNTKLKNSSKMSGGDTDKERRLRTKIRELQSVIFNETMQEDSEQRGRAGETYRHSLSQAQEQYRRLLTDVKIKNPDYHAMVAVEPAPISLIQSNLEDKTAILEYFITEEELLIFTISNSSLNLTRIPVAEKSIRGRILLFRGTAVDDIDRQKLTGNDWIKPLNGLYKMLVAPVEEKKLLENITHLILVPHGQLHYLPFQSLITHYNSNNNESERPFFLIEKYDISYSPSASLLQFFSSKKEIMQQNIMLLAPNISELPNSEQEIKDIAVNFGNNADLFKDDQAKESLVKRDARNYQYLHFATTAHFNSNNPLFSCIDLHQCLQDDGSLEVNEIFNLNLKARLTILSACKSALASGFTTSLPNGDDLVSLTRAFLYAGSSAVIASLWEVADPATAEFMPLFYQNAGKYHTARALAETQRAFIRNHSGQDSDMYYHPYYWAPFILAGAW